MDVIVLVMVSITILVILNILAMAYFDFRVQYENMKTRKDIQEVKTRLTQVRKDLNTIENKLKRSV